ncbi:MAG TPA: hypothetical protein VI979_00445, partial [archaeon]|nr:hypothetical protein [archaeon]
LIVPKTQDYLAIVRKCGRGGSDGYGLCGPVSAAVSLGLQDAGADTLFIGGSYTMPPPCENAEPHIWFSLQYAGQEYSVDMTHRQTGSPDMVVVMPVVREAEMKLIRGKVLPVSQKTAKFYYRGHQELMDGLYRLFGGQGTLTT